MDVGPPPAAYEMGLDQADKEEQGSRIPLKSSSSRLPPVHNLPWWRPYQPPPPPKVPIRIGERRCDNLYHGVILPCLLRPQLPPFSYSTEANYYNTEYKKRK